MEDKVQPSGSGIIQQIRDSKTRTFKYNELTKEYLEQMLKEIHANQLKRLEEDKEYVDWQQFLAGNR